MSGLGEGGDRDAIQAPKKRTHRIPPASHGEGGTTLTRPPPLWHGRRKSSRSTTRKGGTPESNCTSNAVVVLEQELRTLVPTQ
eukprot:scaffold598_cov318-Pavlova_lutheri.AAC.22